MHFLLDTNDSRCDHMRSHALIALHDRPNHGRCGPCRVCHTMWPLHHAACTDGSIAIVLCSTLQRARNRLPSRMWGHSKPFVPWITESALLTRCAQIDITHSMHFLLTIVSNDQQHNKSFVVLKARCIDFSLPLNGVSFVSNLTTVHHTKLQRAPHTISLPAQHIS